MCRKQYQFYDVFEDMLVGKRGFPTAPARFNVYTLELWLAGWLAGPLDGLRVPLLLDLLAARLAGGFIGWCLFGGCAGLGWRARRGKKNVV